MARSAVQASRSCVSRMARLVCSAVVLSVAACSSPAGVGLTAMSDAEFLELTPEEQCELIPLEPIADWEPSPFEAGWSSGGCEGGFALGPRIDVVFSDLTDGLMDEFPPRGVGSSIQFEDIPGIGDAAYLSVDPSRGPYPGPVLLAARTGDVGMTANLFASSLREYPPLDEVVAGLSRLLRAVVEEMGRDNEGELPEQPTAPQAAAPSAPAEDDVPDPVLEDVAGPAAPVVEEYWRLNDVCRGETGPAADAACYDRDLILEEVAIQQMLAFVDAWDAGDRAAVEALTSPGALATVPGTVLAEERTDAPPTFSYDYASGLGSATVEVRNRPSGLVVEFEQYDDLQFRATNAWVIEAG